MKDKYESTYFWQVFSYEDNFILMDYRTKKLQNIWVSKLPKTRDFLCKPFPANKSKHNILDKYWRINYCNYQSNQLQKGMLLCFRKRFLCFNFGFDNPCSTPLDLLRFTEHALKHTRSNFSF